MVTMHGMDVWVLGNCFALGSMQRCLLNAAVHTIPAAHSLWRAVPRRAWAGTVPHNRPFPKCL